MRMTPFITLGRIVVPALSMAMTKGLAVASATFAAFPNRGSVYGTRRPTIVNATR
jgi:hypothetical protein